MSLANDGLFREMRYFTPWTGRAEWVWYDLPAVIKESTRQDRVKFGDVVLKTHDTIVGSEIIHAGRSYVYQTSPAFSF